MIIKEDIYEGAIVELGNRVGLNWKNLSDALAYEKKHGPKWNQTKIWTVEDEKGFTSWFEKYLKEKTHLTKRQIQFEVGTFILNYGWKTKWPE